MATYQADESCMECEPNEDCVSCVGITFLDEPVDMEVELNTGTVSSELEYFLEA
jgi:hypothetical protein